jgi:hypothetical protein
VPHPSSRHPTIRVISCSWEEHDFSRAIKTKKDPGTANPRDADQNHQAPAPKGRQTTAQDVSPGSGQKKIQASQTRPTGQKADRPLTSLPIPPPPCESSPNSCHPERSRGTLRPPRSGVPHPFFAHFAKKGGTRDDRKAQSVKGHDFSRAIKIRKRFRPRKPARPDKKKIARSPLFQSLRRPVNHLPRDGIILNLDVAVGKAALRVPHVSRLSRHGIPCSGVIRIVLAISINKSNSSDTRVPR